MFSLRNRGLGTYSLKSQDAFDGGVDWRFDMQYNGSNTYMDFCVFEEKGIDWSNWNHIAVTRSYDSATGDFTAIVYVNGVQMDIDEENAPSLVSPTQFFIGKAYDAAKVFNGNIGNFRVYNRILSKAELGANYLDEAKDYGINTSVYVDGDVTWTTADDLVDATTSIKASFTLKNGTLIDRTIFGALALYSENGCLLKCAANPAISLLGGDSTPVNLELTGISVPERCYAKIYIWEAGTLRPLMGEAIELNYEVYL